MEIKIYKTLPNESMEIRRRVFVEEQGFTDSPGAMDATALHIVAYDGEVAVATARLCEVSDGDWLVGRIAVLPERRGGGIGRLIVSRAEDEARMLGASRLTVHAQMRAHAFYSAIGYSDISAMDTVEGQPHIWMAKKLTSEEEK